MKVTKIGQKNFLWTIWGFLVTIIFDIKIDVNMCEPHYVNLYFLWTSSIVHVVDFLTFDIIFATWHLFDNLTSFWQLSTRVMGHMGHGAHGQWDTWAKGIVINIEDIDGVPWGMGHMSNGAHGQHIMCWIMCNFLNTAWILTKILLSIDIDVFYLNTQWYCHDGLN